MPQPEPALGDIVMTEAEAEEIAPSKSRTVDRDATRTLIAVLAKKGGFKLGRNSGDIGT